MLEDGDGGEKPGPEDVVAAHFTGWLEDGTLLESTVMNGKPAQFKLDQVTIKGWVEGLQLMAKGEKRRFWIPAALGFGENPPPGAPQGNLIFDFQLLEFKAMPKAPEPISAPDDVAAAPSDSVATDSGLASKVLSEGSGSSYPSDTDEVLVHYTGWTTDGKMFDSSVARGEPISFPLNGVIKGWTEGVQLMVEGEKRRFWIPGNLAYGETPSRPGAPSGTLVFDVELIKIGK
ncbi:FKBP-type peptidyl-prolyl cis-trans isomerase [bacterium]|nr:FKBP-type peptidyl-prolyl cis-trans isomerase [bacterium]